MDGTGQLLPISAAETYGRGEKKGGWRGECMDSMCRVWTGSVANKARDVQKSLFYLGVLCISMHCTFYHYALLYIHRLNFLR